ncbi:MAG: glycosyltransferase family 39 protein [Candidatus Moranbacteria bacterium]|nr:glycosyltransferase family 39 protein [Candidatus Moranbacteria bacterium]
MNLRQIVTSKITLGLIVAVFIIKGILLSFLIPVFQNPDEQIHYGTVQYWAEPTERNWVIQNNGKRNTVSSDISTYGLSEEIIHAAQSTQFDEIKFEKQNIQNFSDTDSEKEILQNNRKHYVEVYPTNTSGTKSVYYLFAAWLERLFSDESIFTRIFVMRFLTVLFGLGVIILAYVTAKKIGFSENLSLLFTTLIAFQPMLSITGAQVNIDIALIFAFSLFFYAGVSLMKDLEWKYVLLIIFSALMGLFSKGPGIVLVVLLYPLFTWFAYQKLPLSKKRFATFFIVTTLLLATLLFLVVPKSYFVSITNFTAQSKFSSPLESTKKYLDQTLSLGEIRDTSLSYWGHFGWLDNAIPHWSLSIITFITFFGFIGTIWYLFSQKQVPCLPEKKYLVLSLGMILALQIAIRFYDWRVYDYTGEILIGQPGRYFLPNIIAHLLIVITGIGFFLRQKTRFIFVIKILALSMILLQLHAIVNVIIPRYYL